MNNHFNVKKAVAIISIASAFFLIGCQTDSRITYLNLRPAGDEILGYIEEFEAFSFGAEMGIAHSFGVTAENFEFGSTDDFYGVIEISDTTNKLVAQIGSISTHDFYLILKVFVNYEEVSFRVHGEDAYATEFVFFLERGYQVDIPFTIDSRYLEEDAIYKLTAGVFVDPHRDVINEDNLDFFWGRTGMALNNDLILGFGNNIEFETPPYHELIYRRKDDQFVDLFIAPEFELNEYGVLPPPPLNIQARRGEEIELLFYASPLAALGYELENYLIIGMLDWQQTHLSGHPFLFIDASESEFDYILDHGMLTLNAIDEVGIYDFIAILIPNPSHPNSLTNSVPLRTSNRLVIEIIE